MCEGWQPSKLRKMLTNSCGEGLVLAANVRARSCLKALVRADSRSTGRRRKIKCIYDDDDNNVCQECTAHNRECTKQGVVRGSSNNQNARSVKVQVTRLESAVEKLAREKSNVDSTGPIEKAPASLGTLDSGGEDFACAEQPHKKRSPIFSLFNNEIVWNWLLEGLRHC